MRDRAVTNKYKPRLANTTLRLTGPFRGESTDNRLIPLIKKPVMQNTFPHHDIFMPYERLSNIKGY